MQGSVGNLTNYTYIRMFNGRPDEMNSDANVRTDVIELRSNSM